MANIILAIGPVQMPAIMWDNVSLVFYTTIIVPRCGLRGNKSTSPQVTFVRVPAQLFP